MLSLAVLANHKDNVATAVKSLKKGQEILLNLNGQEFKVMLNEDVPFGHKFAVRDIVTGDNIIKYGESIGSATCNITVGNYVHVHNIESRRARGDLEVLK